MMDVSMCLLELPCIIIIIIIRGERESKYVRILTDISISILVLYSANTRCRCRYRCRRTIRLSWLRVSSGFATRLHTVPRYLNSYICICIYSGTYLLYSTLHAYIHTYYTYIGRYGTGAASHSMPCLFFLPFFFFPVLYQGRKGT